MELKGKTAIVTGSGRGIGEGIALVLAREGANLVINDRKITADAEGVVRKIEAMGGRVVVESRLGEGTSFIVSLPAANGTRSSRVESGNNLTSD